MMWEEPLQPVCERKRVTMCVFVHVCGAFSDSVKLTRAEEDQPVEGARLTLAAAALVGIYQWSHCIPTVCITPTIVRKLLITHSENTLKITSNPLVMIRNKTLWRKYSWPLAQIRWWISVSSVIQFIYWYRKYLEKHILQQLRAAFVYIFISFFILISISHGGDVWSYPILH